MTESITPVDAPMESPADEEAPMEELAEAARDLYQQIINGLEVDAAVGITGIDGTDIHLAADGDEEQGGILIGRRGQTLDAVQTLVWTITQRHVERRVRVFIDAFGYRENRAEALRQMALEVALQVVAQNQEALTEPLNAAERRIVHNALTETPGVSTYSEGEDPNRYVVITPSDD